MLFTEFLTKISAYVDERYPDDYTTVNSILLQTNALLLDRAKIKTNHSLAVYITLLSVWSYAHNADQSYTGVDAATKHLCFNLFLNTFNTHILIFDDVNLLSEWYAPVVESQSFEFNDGINQAFLCQRRRLFLTSLCDMNHDIQEANVDANALSSTLFAAFAFMVIAPVLNYISSGYDLPIFALSVWGSIRAINQASYCGEKFNYYYVEPVKASFQRYV